ncbi:MAG: T9SS type A sorting domain-containing protein [Flavobacteriaceae bacterium]
MKKVVIGLITILFSYINYGQDGALYQNWYLSSYEIAGESTSVSTISPSISPTLFLDQDLGYIGYAACNNYNGNFSYDNVNDLLILDNFDATLSLCDYISHDNFETGYFSLFVINQPYSYTIVYDDNYEYLELELSPDTILHYRNSPLFSINNFSTEAFSIYPNPVSEQLFVFSENKQIEQIIIYSLLGNIIIEQKNESIINVSSFPSGVYFIEIYSSEGKTVKKFIKN